MPAIRALSLQEIASTNTKFHNQCFVQFAFLLSLTVLNEIVMILYPPLEKRI